jgi:hypothetical protein
MYYRASPLDSLVKFYNRPVTIGGRTQRKIVQIFTEQDNWGSLSCIVYTWKTPPFFLPSYTYKLRLAYNGKKNCLRHFFCSQLSCSVFSRWKSFVSKNGSYEISTSSNAPVLKLCRPTEEHKRLTWQRLSENGR